jgi:hypothetical protein
MSKAKRAKTNAPVQGSGIVKLLGTEDPIEQEKRIQQLLQMATVPVLVMTIRKDLRSGAISMGGLDRNVPLSAVKAVLDEVKEIVIAQEIEAKNKAKKEEEPVPPEGA